VISNVADELKPRLIKYPSITSVYIYQQFAVSSFGAHPILGTIGILTQIMAGVIKPFVAKVSPAHSIN
jgi:hypothetical protein